MATTRLLRYFESERIGGGTISRRRFNKRYFEVMLCKMKLFTEIATI